MANAHGQAAFHHRTRDQKSDDDEQDRPVGES
jgi:hypothetical protein